MAAPVILEMDVHCSRCAKKIRTTVWSVLGVERMWVSRDTGLVVVAGTADADVLRGRLSYAMNRSVRIVRDGGEHLVGIQHLAPSPTHYAAPPPPHHHYYGGRPGYHHYWPPQYDGRRR